MVAQSSVSARKIEANRANAGKSTGPKTPEGKARSSHNRLCHGFYSNEVLLKGEDAEELEQLQEALHAELAPHGAMETLIVDRLVALHWKLRRMISAESQMIEQKMLCRQVESDRGVAALIHTGHGELERLSMFQQRLENSIHRCMRELRQMRKEECGMRNEKRSGQQEEENQGKQETAGEEQRTTDHGQEKKMRFEATEDADQGASWERGGGELVMEACGAESDLANSA